MKKNRFVFDALLFGAVFYASWWFVVVGAIIGTFLFRRHYEVIAAGVLYDLLYGELGYGGAGLGGVIGLVSSVVLLLVMERVKKEIRT